MDDDREYYRGWYGFSYWRLIWPILIGTVLILLGLSALLGIDIWQYFWPALAIILGLLIIFGAIFGRRRRYMR